MKRIDEERSESYLHEVLLFFEHLQEQIFRKDDFTQSLGQHLLNGESELGRLLDERVVLFQCQHQSANHDAAQLERDRPQ